MAYRVKRARSLAEAWECLAADPEARLVAGGTDLLPRINQGIESHPQLLCIDGLEELRGIDGLGEYVEIGALTTLAEITESRELAGYAALHHAASRAASPQIRNRATVGGNVLQENRCIYFNQSVSWRRVDCCFKLGGDRCYQYKGSRECVALFQSDLAPVLMAHRAEAVLRSPRGERSVLLEELYLPEGKKAMERDEILTALRIPKTGYNIRSAYARETIRGSFDFPIVSCAVVLDCEGDVIRGAVMVLGSAGVMPRWVPGVRDTLTGKPLSAVADAVAGLQGIGRKQIAPFRDTRVDAAVRRAMGEEVIERALRQAAGE